MESYNFQVLSSIWSNCFVILSVILIRLFIALSWTLFQTKNPPRYFFLRYLLSQQGVYYTPNPQTIITWSTCMDNWHQIRSTKMPHDGKVLNFHIIWNLNLIIYEWCSFDYYPGSLYYLWVCAISSDWCLVLYSDVNCSMDKYISFILSSSLITLYIGESSSPI